MIENSLEEKQSKPATGQSFFVFTIHQKDLVTLSYRIAKAIPAGLLTSSKGPVIATVDGSFASGKKIYADICREALLTKRKLYTERSLFGDLVIGKRTAEMYLSDEFERSYSFAGKLEYDEYVTGNYAEEKIEVSFVNSAWPSAQYSFLAKPNLPQSEIISLHLQNRRRPQGIAFIHNSPDLMDTADLSVWIESADKAPVHDRGYRYNGFKEGLKKAFARSVMDDEKWMRYVEVTIRHEDLLSCKPFMESLERLNFKPVHERGKVFPVVPQPL